MFININARRQKKSTDLNLQSHRSRYPGIQVWYKCSRFFFPDISHDI